MNSHSFSIRHKQDYGFCTLCGSNVYVVDIMLVLINGDHNDESAKKIQFNTHCCRKKYFDLHHYHHYIQELMKVHEVTHFIRTDHSKCEKA